MNAPVTPLPVKRRRWTWPDWPAGLYEDAAGHHFDGEQLDRATLNQCITALARYYVAPAMLFDLATEGTLDLARPDMAGVVAAAWSCTRIPERALPRADWVDLFRANGYSLNGRHAELPVRTPRLFRGCVPQWLHLGRNRRVVEVDPSGLPADPYAEIVESIDTRLGMAWTTRLATARRFADHRQHAYAITDGQVFATAVAPRYLLAVVGDAVIVDPAGLRVGELESIELKAVAR